MRILEVVADHDFMLRVLADDGRTGVFDVSPYLKFDAFRPLSDWSEFVKLHNGGYFVEWECGADLSADTIEARLIDRADTQGS